jgi:hypothetical protein
MEREKATPTPSVEEKKRRSRAAGRSCEPRRAFHHRRLWR